MALTDEQRHAWDMVTRYVRPGDVAALEVTLVLAVAAHLAEVEATARALQEALLRSCWFVDIPSDTPVQWVGVHPLRWGKVDEPAMGFGRWDEDAVRALLLQEPA